MIGFESGPGLPPHRAGNKDLRHGGRVGIPWPEKGNRISQTPKI